MDRHEQVLVCRGADQVRGGQKLPRQHRRIPEEVGAGNLHQDDAEDDILCDWFGAAEFCYLFWFFVSYACMYR